MPLPNGDYKITATLLVEAKNLDGSPEIRSVFYRIYRPSSSDYFSQGIMSRKIDNQDSTSLDFTSNLTFVISRVEVGAYRIEVYAMDISNLPSNTIQVALLITRNNSTPQLTSAMVPDTVLLPPGDSLLIKMFAAASDSDGLSDISEVFFYSLNSSDPTRKFQLLDDGSANPSSLSGDALAGDGTYTITVKLLDQGDVRRTFNFEFHAVDRQGAESLPVIKTLTVI